MNDPKANPQSPRLEVCVGSLDDARVAAAAGADRLELCAALELGGLTPSIGLAEQVIGESGLPVVVMIRPRAAGFAYNESEFRCMRADAVRLLDAGAAGIVFGMLDAGGRIDAARVAELVSIAGNKDTVFHKGFDAIRSMEPAIASLVTAGVTRVLTSGGAPTAEEGKATLRQLVAWSQGRIEIMPGGGVDAANAAGLLAETGCAAVHVGAATSRFDPSTSSAAAAALCDLERLHAGACRAVDGDRVAAVREAIDARVAG